MTPTPKKTIPMVDKPADSTHEIDVVHTQVSARHFRWKAGALIVSAGATAVWGITQLIPDQTFRMIGIYYGVVIWAVVALIWWLVFSGVRREIRLGCLMAVVAFGIGAWFGLVRQLKFNGAMAPKIVWTWQQTADELRNAWQDKQAGSTLADASLNKSFIITEADWPRYRGADGDGVVDERLTIRDWTKEPPKLLWRHPLGEAWSSFAVVGPRLFTQEQRGEQECVVCYHAASGNELWVHQDNVRYETAMGGIGPRATPTVTDSALYAVGAKGLLTCLDPVTGKKQWQRSLLDDAQTKAPEWGFAGSPLIWKDTVIVIAGSSANTAVLAYDQVTGEIVWGSGNHRAGYSSPRIETIGGQPVLLAFHGDGLAALNPDDGEQLWNYPFSNMYHVNVAQPLLVGTNLFIGTGYDGRCVALDPGKLTDGQPAELWVPNRNLKLKFNEAVVRDGFVYGLDDGILCCIDVATGKRKWKGGRYNFGQLLLWDGILLVQAEKGYVTLVEASPASFKEITRFSALTSNSGMSARVWNVPVVNQSRLYIRSDREAACFQLPQRDAN
jgi:outer membrane protein assembly factor BamB